MIDVEKVDKLKKKLFVDLMKELFDLNLLNLINVDLS